MKPAVQTLNRKLINAVATFDIRKLVTLLESGAEPFTFDEYHDSPFVSSIRHENFQATQLFIQHQKSQDNFGELDLPKLNEKDPGEWLLHMAENLKAEEPSLLTFLNATDHRTIHVLFETIRQTCDILGQDTSSF